uniref:Uncharacterized protein n=1 Tax=Panagrolaimus superbus TaxID=310955 RepID=A0A914YXJ9_9BILA
MINLDIRVNILYTDEVSSERQLIDVNLLLHPLYEIICFESSGLPYELPFVSLNKIKEQLVEFRRLPRSCVLCFENQEIANKFLNLCIEKFTNRSIIKNTVLRAFVMSKESAISLDKMESLTNLLRDLYKNLNIDKECESKKGYMMELLDEYELDNVIAVLHASQNGDQTET